MVSPTPKQRIMPVASLITIMGKIEATIPTGKTIFQSEDKLTKSTNKKEERQIKPDKRRSWAKVVMEREKITSYEPRLLLS